MHNNDTLHTDAGYKDRKEFYDKPVIKQKNRYDTELYDDLLLLNIAADPKLAPYVVSRYMYKTDYGGFIDLRYQEPTSSGPKGWSTAFRSKDSHPLDGKIVIIPESLWFNLQQHTCNQILSGMLDGYDGISGTDGKPRLILLGLLLCMQAPIPHVVTLVIEPCADGTYAVSYLDPLGGYNAEKQAIASFVRQRYKTEMRTNTVFIQDNAYDCVPLSIECQHLAAQKVAGQPNIPINIDEIAQELDLTTSLRRRQAHANALDDDVQRSRLLYYANNNLRGQKLSWMRYHQGASYEENNTEIDYLFNNKKMAIHPYDAQRDQKLELLANAPALSHHSPDKQYVWQSGAGIGFTLSLIGIVGFGLPLEMNSSTAIIYPWLIQSLPEDQPLVLGIMIASSVIIAVMSAAAGAATSHTINAHS